MYGVTVVPTTATSRSISAPETPARLGVVSDEATAAQFGFAKRAAAMYAKKTAVSAKKIRSTLR
jgi:hypothetical protein